VGLESVLATAVQSYNPFLLRIFIREREEGEGRGGKGKKDSKITRCRRNTDKYFNGTLLLHPNGKNNSVA
jgi:hypothetical protein